MATRQRNRIGRPRVAARLVLLAGSVIVSLILAELLLHIVPLPGKRYLPTAVPDGDRSRTAGPDFRDRSHPGSKPDGTFRILAVGDSITWGSGMHSEDAFPDRLDRAVRQLPSTRPIEVLNFSRPGWSTEQEWLHSRPQLNSIAPDLLIVGFCLNDAELGPTARKQPLADANRRSAEGPVLNWLVDHSILARTLFERTENIRQRRAVRAYYHNLYVDPLGWSGCVKSLESFRHFAVRHHIPLVLVVFPVFDGQIDAGYPYREIHRQIRDTGAEIGITVLDLLPVFEGMDARRLAVAPFTDPHPNELAHRIAADAILDLLIRRHWLPLADGVAP